MSKIEHNLEPTIGIHSDIPLCDPVADEFGYVGFAGDSVTGDQPVRQRTQVARIA